MHWHRTYFAEIAFSFDGFQIKRISKFTRGGLGLAQATHQEAYCIFEATLKTGSRGFDL